MNLVMLDIDGTLTQSYEYDKEIFGRAIGEVLGLPSIDADLNGYVNKTSLGVTEEAIYRITGRNPKAEEIEEVKRIVINRLERLYKENPANFREVPGASVFLERLRNLSETAIAIATGCWLSEALLKLRASSLDVKDIPLATSDDDRDRVKIMTIAYEKAKQFHACPGFISVVYLGDGSWDLDASASLGYGFVGIGTRIQALEKSGSFRWHKDFLLPEEVLGSIAATIRS